MIDDVVDYAKDSYGSDLDSTFDDYLAFMEGDGYYTTDNPIPQYYVEESHNNHAGT